MMKFILKRLTYLPEGTYGVLCEENGRPFLVTLERPWLNNAKEVSCIPTGDYEVARVTTPLHGECFEVQNVPGRGSILIHAGNTIADSKGCILLGKEYDPVLTAINISKVAIGMFMAKLKGISSFKLTII